MELNLKNAFDIHINSDDRTTGTNTNFNVNISGATSIIGKSGYMCVKDAQIPISSVYMVNNDDVFAFSIDGSSTISFNFIAGSYTVTSILNFIKAQMESLDLVNNTYTFTYSSDSNIINLRATFASGITQIRSSLCSENIQVMLGLGSNNLTISTTGQSVDFPNQVDMTPQYNFYLCTSLSGSTRNIATNERIPKNNILKLYNLSRFTRTFIRISEAQMYIFKVNSLPISFSISLLNENGNDIYLPPNLNTQITLRFFPD